MAKYCGSVRAKEGSSSPVSIGAWAPWHSSFPALCEYLTCELLDDNEPRVTATLLLFCEGGAVKVRMYDRHNERSLWKTGASLMGVLEQLEDDLSSGTGDWRLDRPAGKRK